tara:strand:+ start:2079 stop:2258 length:180 start_codon:yes stop_codon:yes gene_type:complete
MIAFLKKYSNQLALLVPVFLLSINWLLDGRIIVFIVTVIFIVVAIGFWDETEPVSDEEE